MIWTLENKILIQGIDQPRAFPYLQALQSTNTKILAGIVSEYSDYSLFDIPCFELITEAIAQLGEIHTTIIFNNPYDVLDAGLEAINAGIKQIIISTNHIPPLDLCKLFEQAQAQNIKILGPNQAGILIPEKLCLGVINYHLYKLGNIAIINYGHPSLSDELALYFQSQNLGESLIINMGNSYVNQGDLSIWLELLENDQNTEQIVIVFSDYFNLDSQNIHESLSKFKDKKKVIIYLLDNHNFKSLIYNRKNKIISDRVPIHQDRVVSYESMKKIFKDLSLKVAENYQQIIKFIKAKV